MECAIARPCIPRMLINTIGRLVPYSVIRFTYVTAQLQIPLIPLPSARIDCNPSYTQDVGRAPSLEDLRTVRGTNPVALHSLSAYVLSRALVPLDYGDALWSVSPLFWRFEHLPNSAVGNLRQSAVTSASDWAT